MAFLGRFKKKKIINKERGKYQKRMLFCLFLQSIVKKYITHGEGGEIKHFPFPN